MLYPDWSKAKIIAENVKNYSFDIKENGYILLKAYGNQAQAHISINGYTSANGRSAIDLTLHDFNFMPVHIGDHILISGNRLIAGSQGEYGGSIIFLPFKR